MKKFGCQGAVSVCLLIAGLFDIGTPTVLAFTPSPTNLFDHKASVRGDTTQKKIALVFTGGDFADGGFYIRNVLLSKGVRAGFFFTGDFYRNPEHAALIRRLRSDGHYLGPHSDRHLLYCSWSRRDSSLIDRKTFESDLQANYQAMSNLGVHTPVSLFIPPYEWYNCEQVEWAASMGITLFNYTPGVGTQADYTTPEMTGYRTSQSLFHRLFEFEAQAVHGLNGAILLLHIGTHPDRVDKFYFLLAPLIDRLRSRGYELVRIDFLLVQP